MINQSQLIELERIAAKDYPELEDAATVIRILPDILVELRKQTEMMASSNPTDEAEIVNDSAPK